MRKVFLDCGANNGCSVRRFKQIVKNYEDFEIFSFEPNEVFRTDLVVKIETAGSITLVLQTLLLPSLFSGSLVKIKFKGGATDTFFSPPIDYFRFVTLPLVGKIIDSIPDKKGGDVKVDIKKRGFYPEGGAEVEIEVKPLEFSKKNSKGFNLKKRGLLKKILDFTARL